MALRMNDPGHIFFLLVCYYALQELDLTYAGISEQLTCKIVAEDRRIEDVNPGACVQVNRAPVCSLVAFEETLAKYGFFVIHSSDVDGTA